MANYNKQMQDIWKDYEQAGMPTPTTTRDVAAWAIRQGLWRPQPSDVIARCAEDLAKALREEYRTDSRGRRYRAKHAVRTQVNGQQQVFWADIDKAPRAHMEKAFAWRRQQVVGDCFQLKTDVDVYNDAHSQEQPIQMVLDFTVDVEELQLEQTETGAAA